MDAKKREREEKKREREEKKLMKRKEIEERKKERDEKRKMKEREKEEKAMVRAEKKKQKQRRGKRNETAVDSDCVETVFSKMSLEDDDDSAVCPKCGLAYMDDDNENGLWVCCDICNQWFDLPCTNIRNKGRVPNTYICEECKE